MKICITFICAYTEFVRTIFFIFILYQSHYLFIWLCVKVMICSLDCVSRLLFDHSIVSKVLRTNHMQCTIITISSWKTFIIIHINSLIAICDYHCDYQLFDLAIVSRMSQGNPLITPPSQLLFAHITNLLRRKICYQIF